MVSGFRLFVFSHIYIYIYISSYLYLHLFLPFSHLCTEPTSGLDSFSAIQLVKSLKKVANAGSSVLFTIHQPASEIFNSFDHLILLNKGRVMYEGEVCDVPAFFADRGQPVPRLYNPSDWIMSVAQRVPVEELDAAGFFPQDERKAIEAFHVEDGDKGHDSLGITRRESRILTETDSRPVSKLTEVGMLFSREIKNLTRDKGALGARLGLTTFLSLIDRPHLPRRWSNRQFCPGESTKSLWCAYHGAQ